MRGWLSDVRYSGRLIFCAGVALGATAVVGGLWANRLRQPTSLPGIDNSRSIFLRLKAGGAPKHGVLIIGDSISGMVEIEELCGLPVTNASVEGSRPVQWQQLAPDLERRANPAVVVLALGINETQTQLPFDARRFQREYQALAASFKTPVLKVSPLDMEQRVADAYGYHLDLSRVPAIRRAVTANGGLIVQPFDIRGHTIDGGHLDAFARDKWKANLRSYCPQILAMSRQVGGRH